MSVSFLNSLSRRSIFQAALQPDNLLSLARAIFTLIAFFAAILPAFADPATGVQNTTATKVSAAGAFVTISRLGDSVQETALRDGKLLSHRRATDPFGITIRGPFKGLPPAVEQPTAAPVEPAATPAPPQLSQVAAAVNVPTLEKAIQELVVGAINLSSHQILIGSRSIHEGDLLVLQSGGGQFIERREEAVHDVGRGHDSEQCGAENPRDDGTPAKEEQCARHDVFGDGSGFAGGSGFFDRGHVHEVEIVEQADPHNAGEHVKPAKNCVAEHITRHALGRRAFGRDRTESP